MHEGQLIRLAGRGHQGSGGGAAGDLYLRVKFAIHPNFRVRGSDLYYDLELYPWEAVLGTKAKVPTLEGDAMLRILPGTCGGQQFRLRDWGLPRRDGGADYHQVMFLLCHAFLTSTMRAVARDDKQRFGGGLLPFAIMRGETCV